MSDKRPGDRCETCPPDKQQKLVKVNGALVCPKCDNVQDWPSVRDGTAEVER